MEFIEGSNHGELSMKKVLIVGDYKESLGGVSIQMHYLNSFFSESDTIQTEIFSTLSNILLKPIVFIRLLAKARGCDIINSHGCSYSGFITVMMCHIVARLLGKRLIITYHGGGAKDFFDKYPLCKYFLKVNQPLIVPSGFLEAVFAEYGLKSKIIPNAIDLKNFSFKERKNITPKIVSTRNLEDVYNIKAAIDAHVLVQKKYPDAKYTIAGTGPRRKALESYVRQHAIPNVVFAGRVNNADMPGLLAEHDIFINTSLKDNLPVSIVEAFACGLPVVSTNVGGIPFIVNDKKNGLLVEPNNPQDMAAKIIWLLENQKAAMAMLQNARESLSEYDSVSVKEKWQKHFEE